MTMGSDAISHRAATGLFNFNGKVIFQPKNKFSLLFLTFFNLWILLKCLLDVALNCLCLTVTLFISHFYKYAMLIKLCFFSVNRLSPDFNFVTSLKLALFFILMYIFILILADLAKT